MTITEAVQRALDRHHERDMERRESARARLAEWRKKLDEEASKEPLDPDDD